MVVEKVANINAIRTKSADLVAKGETALDPYTFDYLLLCNKICGASHHNMQMKIIVDTPEDYKAWLKDKATIVSEVKAALCPAAPVDGAMDVDTKLKKLKLLSQWANEIINENLK
jgi:cytochrome c oxidase subunit 2